MRKALALGLAVAIGALAAAEDKKDAKKFDASKLEGTWEFKSGEKNGTKVAQEMLKGKVKITKDLISMGEGDMHFEFKYTVDATKTPVAIDMTMTKSPFNMEAKAKGIIEVDGDDVKLCYNPNPDGERPAKFDGEKNHLFVLKKAK
jgi:uncharacterized protein (TIGR03067 family)